MELGVNVLAFGLPGTVKTHALCALAYRLVETGHFVLFTPAYRLVQELLAAKRDLYLSRGRASWTTSTSCCSTTTDPLGVAFLFDGDSMVMAVP